MVKRLQYWEINVENIKNNLGGFLALMLRLHEVVFYALHEDVLIIRLERQEEELERLKKDAELLGIKIN